MQGYDIRYFENFIMNNSVPYYAHLPKDSKTKSAEKLSQHLALVMDYANRLVETHGLKKVINHLITDTVPHKFSNKQLLSETLDDLFWKVIAFHDFGKVNHLFQQKKMKNYASILNVNHDFDSQHSIIGMYIFLADYYASTLHLIITDEERVFLDNCALYLSYAIVKHHSPALKEAKDDCLWNNDKLFALSAYLKLFRIEITDFDIANFHSFILKCAIFGDGLLGQFKEVFLLENSFSLYALCRLNFSLLTATDYLATNEYMNSLPVNDFGTLSKERIEEIYRFVTKAEWLNEIEEKRNYNKTVFDLIDSCKPQNPKNASGDNLNILRQEMAIEVLRNIRKSHQNNLFYIEAPTGGGKTNLSALAAIELLKIYQEHYNKVFYVFPFTTLITQTYKSLKETLGLKDEEMVALHSKAGIKVNDNKEDDNYGNEKLNYINNLFVNFPFAFLSHIRFFDILKTNEKEANYLLHRLANSIVIIDELQSYNPQQWDKVIYFIKQYAAQFNIKFILMSATLPKLDKLNVIKEQAQDFVYLLPDAKKLYFNNPNFAGRVSFNFDLFDRNDLELGELAEKLIEESQAYSVKDFGKAKPLGSVYTIIEFIFKKTATEFHQIIKHTDFFDEIFVLSGTILEHRRRYIINFLKNKSNRKKKILLITTQVVEAGVDIDMDLGFKDRSLIDSDEQLAGRINRNVNKQGCTLFLFNYNKEAIIYGKDKRLELTRKYIKQEQYFDILKNKDFDTLYDLVLNDRNEWNNKEMVENFTDYANKITDLRFQSVHEDFKLIERNNISCFVPVNIPLEVDSVVDGQKEKIFSKIELDFLSQYHVFPNWDNAIDGKKVFDIYIDLIRNKQEFIRQKTYEKILQGIMSKYIFSLFASPKIEQQIVHFSDGGKSVFGYKYIERWNEFYDIETGMRDTDFYSNETQFL